jgi:beta-mannosidase
MGQSADEKGNRQPTFLKINIKKYQPMKTITLILTAMLFAAGINQNLFAQNESNSPTEIQINQNWMFSEAGEDNWLPATVPGTVHIDLMANGIIEDPHYRKNEDDVQWIEDRDWEYRTTFRADRNTIESDVVELYFKGLDTYAEVYLNDQLILESDNMFVGWNVDVKDVIVEGENDLRILFHSPVNKGMEKLRQVDYYIPAVNEQAPMDKRTSVFTRKAPFHYGWDWGPRLVTSGIWRPVVLKAWNHAVIDDVYVMTRYINDERANLAGRAEIEVAQPGFYTFSLTVDGAESGLSETVDMASGINVIPFEFNIDNPKLWWTNGLGEPYLYDFIFELTGTESGLTDRYQLDFGVRTLRLVQEPDEIGRSFYFELNGVPVFMKGANVIPSETLTPAVSEETYRRLFDNAFAANMNMLRVWGGAIYEESIFYELADKHGLLIWQDFMFACNLNPGDEAHLENVRLEAEYNVKRLRNHASIALWTGNNENLHGWHHWGWKEMYEPEIREFMWRTYERKFHEILPEVVHRLDPGTPYWSSSPSAYGNMLADRKSGDEHDWTIWFGQQPFEAYGENVPRFISEYGMQAYPGMHTISEFSIEEDWEWDSPVMRHRQRGGMEYIEPGFDGNDMIRRYMGRYYDVPEQFEHFVYVSQIMHAKAYKTAIEAHRRNMPNTMGSLYWQLNDSWPTISWATVDYYGRWKAAHYSVRKAYEEIIVSPVEEDGMLRVYAVTDRLENLEGAGLEIRLMDFQGTVYQTMSKTVSVDANTSSLVFDETLDSLLDAAGVNENSLVVSVVLLEGGFPIADNLYYFNRPVDLVLPEAEIVVTAEETEDGYLLSVTSDVLVKNLFLDTRFGDLFFEDNYFDLLPGVTRWVSVVTDREINLEEEIRILSLNKLKNL